MILPQMAIEDELINFNRLIQITLITVILFYKLNKGNKINLLMRLYLYH